MMEKSKVRINYSRKGTMKIKPSEVIKHGAGKQFINKMSSSNLAKAIRENRVTEKGLIRG